MATARTSVWWDIENCPVPKGWDALGITQNIRSALLKMNYSGPVSISAYGNINLIPSSVQQALSSTAVSLHHVPSGVKDASDKKILVDMLLWAVDNPAPANVMLISGDRDFSNALHHLSMRRYTILLAQPPSPSASLVAAAKTVWLWTSLAAGGHPLTRGDSSGMVVDDCYPSEHSLSRQWPDSDSDNAMIEEGGSKGDYIPLAANEPGELETKRYKFQSGGDSTDSAWLCKICNVACSSLENFLTHLSDERHVAQVAFVASCGSQVCVPNKQTKVVQPLSCNIGQISCNDNVTHANHILRQNHRKNLELMSAKTVNMSTGLSEFSEDEVEKKKKVNEGGPDAKAGMVCGLCSVVCESQAVFESHMRCRKHAAQAKKQAEEPFDATKIQGKCWREKCKPREEGTSERSVEECIPSVQEWKQRENKLLPKAEGSFNGPSYEFPALEEVRECFDAIVKHTNASAGSAERPEEAVDKKKKKLIENGVEVNAIHVCDLCSVVCDSQIVFESHLKGRKHAAKVKNQGEVGLPIFKSQISQILESVDIPLTKSECVFTDIKREYPVPEEARECNEESIKEIELSGDVSENKLLTTAECSFTGPSCEFPALEEVRECLDTIINPKNASAGLAESPEEAVEKKKKKLIEAGVEANAILVCDLCSVVSVSQIVFESHLKGRKHVAKVQKQGEAISDDKEIQEACIRGKDPAAEVIEEELRFQSTEEQENIKIKETTESASEICGYIEMHVESEDKPLPKAECIFTDLNEPCVTRDCNEESIKKIEFSGDVIENKLLPNAECSFTGPSCEFSTLKEESVCFDGITELQNASTEPAGSPEEAVHKKKRRKRRKKKKLFEGEVKANAVHVCDLCSVVCICEIVFESHLKGRKHAAKAKMQGAAISDAKKIQEECIRGKDESAEAIEELCFQAPEEQENNECLEKQSEEATERYAGEIFERIESEFMPLEAREGFDESIKKTELSGDVNMMEELEEELGSQILQASDTICTLQ